MAEPICFVIGAGASADYGLPTGLGLRKKLIDEKLPKLIESGSGVEANEYSWFSHTFRQSGIESIDRFLSLRPEFSRLGKAAIAAVIGEAESEAEQRLNQGWMPYLYNRFITRWGEVSKWQVRFISFNYDSLLECAFANMIAHTKMLDIKDSWSSVMSSLRVHHVYGRLEGVPHFDSLTDTCDLSRGLRDPLRESGGIRVIGEERLESQVDPVALSYMRDASTVVFLGFGFDVENCVRIGLGRDRSISNGEIQSKRWVVTAVGKVGRELDHISNMIGKDLRRCAVGSSDIESGSCERVLREYLTI